MVNLKERNIESCHKVLPSVVSIQYPFVNLMTFKLSRRTLKLVVFPDSPGPQ